MRVKFLLLTHFSQRYPKVPLFPVFKSSDYNSNLLYSHIFDVLPSMPYNHYGGSRGDFNRFSDNTEISTVSSATTPSTNVSLSPSNSVSVLTPASNSQCASINGLQKEGSQKEEEPKPKLLEPPKIKTRSHPSSIMSQLQPLMFIPTEVGLSPQQVIPSAKETIAEIEKMMEDMPEDPNYQMKIGMAVDHFHLRVGYDEPCMEWITEAMRILIPDDEEDDDEDDEDEETSGSSEKKRIEKLNRIRNKENYNKTNKGNAKRNEAKKEKYLSVKINDKSLSDSSKSIEITSAESESDTQNHERPTPVDDPIFTKRIKF
ncbi:hypothetical protein PIROE2DRAFT_18262 [Piromyces sp. E2]|nr:hypothetical protein PIROE2DRAFT_18262 [Piromyces sp. E2]|eukprot:OUM56922.1 hypothetical protein PIROE2DRAFT_18262 [Piromyces sp. E2]